jgi:hypothetical protein
MSDEAFIFELFFRVDERMLEVKKHSQALLYPSEVVTLAILFVLKGGTGRAFYRWVERNWSHLFPKLPERTRLFRLFKSHQHWSERFLADPTMLGVIDSYGIELIHPIRAGRSANQCGKKGISNHRWIVGGKLCLLLNQWGQIVRWDCATANVHDSLFHPLIEQLDGRMIVFGDTHFHKRTGDPTHLKLCKRGEHNFRMLIETVLSMLTTVCHFKKLFHRAWEYFKAHLGWMMATFNILTTWHGLVPDEEGFIKLSIAQFSL